MLTFRYPISTPIQILNFNTWIYFVTFFFPKVTQLYMHMANRNWKRKMFVFFFVFELHLLYIIIAMGIFYVYIVNQFEHLTHGDDNNNTMLFFIHTFNKLYYCRHL